MFELPERIPDSAALTDAHAAALEAFIRFSEASNTVLDLPTLMTLFTTIHASTLPQEDPPRFVTAAYGRDGQTWRFYDHRGSMSDAALAVVRQGLPLDTPPMAQMAQERRPLFVEWDPDAVDIPETGMYEQAGFYPLLRQNEPAGFVAFGLFRLQPLSEREKLVFLALGRALQLALERAWDAQAREEQRRSLEGRVHVLDTFAERSRELALLMDPAALIWQAEDLLVSLLPGISVRYLAVQDDRWQVQSQVGPWSPEMTWEVRPLPGATALPTLSTARQQAERQPVWVSGTILGVLDVTWTEGTSWDRVDQVVLKTVAAQLGLTLERAGQLQGLKWQQLELQNRLDAAHGQGLENEVFNERVWRDLRCELAALGGEVDRTQPLLTRLDALVAYARSAHRPLHRIPLSLMALTMHVKAELLGGQGVEWHLRELPEVMADREALRSVLRELLSNALKFTRDERSPRIEVWSEAGSEGRVVFVRDNGVGFEPEQGTALFSSTMRRQAGELREQGLGLLTARRLVERHGGRVWAEGQPGRGATFAFTLP